MKRLIRKGQFRLLLILPLFVAWAQDPGDEATQLVRQLGQFPAAIDARVQSHAGQPMPVEQQRAAIWTKLRTLGDRAIPALQQGLMTEDVQLRRNVALYLNMQGFNFPQQAPLSLNVFLPQLIGAFGGRNEAKSDARVLSLFRARLRMCAAR
jgi:hypothetical protein